MDKRTCTIDGCTKDVFCRGMCGMHYNRARRAGSLPSRPMRLECAHCGDIFDVLPSKSGKAPSYCSSSCSSARYLARNKDRINADRRAAHADGITDAAGHVVKDTGGPWVIGAPEDTRLRLLMPGAPSVTFTAPAEGTVLDLVDVVALS